MISSLLNKHGFRIIFESNNVVLTKRDIFVGKRYVCNELFKLNVTIVIPKKVNKVNFSAFLLESSNLWHGILGHINYDILYRLFNLDHIHIFQIDSKPKRETCFEAKMIGPSFHSIKSSTESLYLIYNDLCYLKFLEIKGDNNYFIIFVNNSAKYCYVYLLKSKMKL